MSLEYAAVRVPLSCLVLLSFLLLGLSGLFPSRDSVRSGLEICFSPLEKLDTDSESS